MKKKFTLLLFIFLFANALFSQNLLVNGGFEIGGSGVGFVTNGAGYTLLTTPYSGTTTTGNFAFTTNPNLINTANFIPSSDHTSGNGKMLIIDGNTTAGNPRFWKAGNTGAGITTLTIGTTYRFSYWIKSVSSLVTGPASQADIGVQITGGTATLIAGTTLAPLPALGWRHVVYSFTATATTATIELWNNNISASGNDFAVDDFMLTDDLMVTYNVTDALCATASDGSITVTGLGGTLPYTNYTITGPVTLSNATGVFAGVPPGIYTVSVTDSALPTAATVSMGNVVVGPSLTISPTSSAVCIGSSTTLTAVGSSNPYTWTATPAATAGLTTPGVANPTVTPTAAVVHTYTASSTIGACTVTKSINITVNPLPTANITGNATICPGNTAVITITGTPNSSVTIKNNLGSTIPQFIGASGTLLWTTPILNATTVYCLESVKNFATTCQRNYTGVCVTITVVPNGCATVGTIPGPTSLPLDLTLCTSGECRVIQANISNVPSTSTYSATSIPYCPYPFTDPSYNVVPITGGDDFWSDVINLPFNFCFYGNNYTSCNAGTNGLLTFVPKTPGSFCPWPSTSVPISGQNQSQSIFGVYQDTDMAIPPAAADRQVNWVLQGTYPCRKLIVNFYNLGQWNSVATNPGLQTSQIVLYEVSNIIEVFVQRRVAGSPWAGSGAIGLIGGSAAQWAAAPGRDTGNWSANSEAWRFTPTGHPVPVVINWLQGATPIGTGASVTVCPTATTTYTANAVYNVCGVPQTATTSVTLNVNPDLTNSPVDITQCNNTFNLTTNAGVILGSLNPTDYDISYHLSAADAATVSNPIANPTAFVSSGQTIYVAIYLNSYGCTVVKPFNLIVSCGAISPVPDLTLCESSLGSGTAVFDLTPQTAIALGSEPATDYTFTYYTSLAAANAGIPGTEINPINAFVGTNQTIYIRMQYNAIPATYYTTDFDLIVRSIANAGLDGNTTVCETSTTAINLFSLITGEQTGGVWTRTGPGTGGTFNATAGTFTPAVGASTSTFEYTVTGVAPCVNDTSVATINIIPQPIAGSDGGIVICASSATPIDLFSLITGEQPGGVWTRTGGTGGVFNAAGGTFTPTAGSTTSTFEYTLTGASPCVTDFSVATVTISGQPDAGLDGTTTVCETSTTVINLFSLITGEQPGGVWTRTGTGGTFDATAGTFTPAVGATTSTFTYTLSGVAPCITDTSVATINILPQPIAGSDGGTVICASSATPIDLFSLITGEQTGGVWTRTGTGTGGIFNAAGGTFTPTAGSTTSTFEYTLTGASPCVTDFSVATITIAGQPNAGVDGSIVVCETSTTAINLSSLITGEQAGGVWTRTGTGTGGTFDAVAGTFTPAVGASNSTFSYTLSGVAPCITDTSEATVNIIAQPTAGADGATTVCETSTTPIDLFSLITGEQAGGVWTRTGTGGTFNAAAGTFTPAIGATASTFTYTVSGVAPCTTDSSIATITINPQPTAGVDGGTIVCETSTTAINLFSLITGEQAGGVWTRTGTGTGGTFDAVAGTFTPAIGATTSTFEYTVSGVAPCTTDSSIATVTINAQPNAGTDGGTIVCETSTTAVDLFSLITGEQAGGVWTRTGTGTGGTFDAVAGTFTPAIGATTSTFTYTLIGTAPCINDTSVATITINAQPTAGVDGGITICENSTAVINLNTLITGEQAGGVWTRTGTGTGGTFNAAAGTFTPAIGVTTSTFAYTVNGVAPCINDSSEATVTINPLPTATISGTTAVCMNSASPQITLTGANGTAPYTFTYSINTVVQPPVSTATGNSISINAPTTSQGVYTYALVSVQDGAAPSCSQTQSGSAVVTVNISPTINTPTPYVVCDDSLDNNGFYCGFDLTTKNAEITSDPTVVITYHETLTDSQTGANPKPSPYCNLVPGLQTLYVRAHFIGSSACYSNTTLQLIVNPIPLPNPIITDYELCDYNNPGDGIEVFNLVTKTNEIANGQAGVTVSYYASLANAQTQTSPLPNLYPNTSNPQQIWINIRDNATGCNTTSSFNLVVNPLPAVTVAPDLNECGISSSLTAEFDLTVNEGTVINGATGLVVTYYNSLAAAQNGSPTISGSPLTYIGTHNETVYIRVENSATGCYATTTQLLRVTQGPTAITPQPLHYCDPNNDGFGVFDLCSTINEITGTPPGSPLPPGVSVTFHETPTDALLGANPKPCSYPNINANTQTIYVRVYYTLTGCANYVNLQLIINPTPVATEPADYELCDYTGLAGFESFDLTSTIPQILGIINPLTHSVTFYTTQGAAELGTGNIPNPTSYISDTQTIYVRVETTATGCYDIVTLQLIVNPLPNATQPNYPQYSLCDTTGLVGFETFDLASQVSAILLGQTGMDVTFYPSLSEAQSGSNAITNLQYPNAIIYVQTLGIRITNRDTGCYVISTMDIRVEPLPTPIPPTQPYTICDDDQDGFSCGFDLTTLLPGLLNGMTTYTITFHETIDDANTGDNPINTATPYCTLTRFVQILYVRAEDNVTHCFSILPIELNTDPSPVAPVNLNTITVCDQDSNPQDARTPVDLTQTTAAVLAQQTGAASDYTVEYYTTQLLAQQGNSPIINDTSYPVSDGDTIWVRVEHKITGCYNVGSFQLAINTPLLLTTPTPLSVCDDDTTPNNQFHVFDLTIKNTEINQGTGYTVTYYPSLTAAQNNTNVITTPSAYQNVPSHPAVQTLGVVVTTTAGCKSITTLDIRVLPIPTPNTNPTPLAPKCDDNNPGDMLEVFDLTVNQTYIGNGDPNLSFHYFATRDNAIDNVSELIPATAALVGTNVWIRVENNRVDYQGENCYVLVEQPLRVNPLPIVVQPLAPYRACDDNADGISVFDLTNPDLAEAILGTTQLPADFTISYHLTQANATAGTAPLPNSYTNVTPNTQDIYIRVVNNATGCVNTGILPLVVEAYARAEGPWDYNECDNDGNPYDGVGLIDLTSYAPDILDGQDATIFLLSYYTSLADAVAGTNALTLAQAQAYQTAANTDTIWVKVENSSNLITPVCYAITTINIRVEPYPNPVITTANDVTTICVDYITNQVVRPLTLNSGVANPNNYTYEWFEDASTTPIPGATGPTYTVDTPAAGGATRAYTVRVTSATPQACQTTSATAFQVIQSGQAVVAAGTTGYTVTSAFSSEQIITVTVEGYGAPDYQYSLDDGPRQASNVFENVSMGTHVIHVWDAKGNIAYSCEELIINEVMIIDYPHYFTPNGDGIHDTWNIFDLADDQFAAKIFIFDRYGKLLKQMSPKGAGWDGTYNGHLLPSDDYWFTVDFAEGGVMKQFKAHFAMKR